MIWLRILLNTKITEFLDMRQICLITHTGILLTRNFFNWTERADVRTWNAAPRNVYDSAFDSYYKSVYTNPEPVVDYASSHTVE
jgi:hypothetical protein